MQSPADTKGFPPGLAEQMVVESYRRFIKNSRDATSKEEKLLKTSTPVPIESSHITTWNGGVTPRYRWSQSIRDITVEVPLPERLIEKKDLGVLLSDSRISIRHKGDILVDGDLTKRVNVSESTWVIEDGKTIILNLEKSKEDWWESLISGDPIIDTSKVESTKRIDEYHPETQAAIRKLLHDEHLKRSGQDPALLKLKEAWDADNSPFKGTPFDPSLLSPRTTVDSE